MPCMTAAPRTGDDDDDDNVLDASHKLTGGEDPLRSGILVSRLASFSLARATCGL